VKLEGLKLKLAIPRAYTPIQQPPHLPTLEIHVKNNTLLDANLKQKPSEYITGEITKITTVDSVRDLSRLLFSLSWLRPCIYRFRNAK